jgi:FkbM family methyltransferase
MLLKSLKVIWYYLPFKEVPAFHHLKMLVYHYLIRRVMKLNYQKVVIKKINGITYELDLSESIEASLYYSGVYELETLKCLQQYINKNMTVFEVGANIGSHSFEIAKLLQEGSGKLYCFEPTDYAFAKLMRNHQLNNFTNITFEKLAFSDSESSEVITPTTSLDTMAFAASWDIKDGSSKNATEQNILFTTLDKYVHKTGIQQLDVLKIDVDGYEFKIIKGGYETISRLHPVIIIELSECLLHYVGDRLEDLLSILYSLGYTIQPVYSQRIPNPASLIQEVKNRKTLDCLCLYKAR